MPEAFELDDEAFGGAFGVAAGEVVAAEVVVELAGLSWRLLEGRQRPRPGARPTRARCLIARGLMRCAHGRIFSNACAITAWPVLRFRGAKRLLDGGADCGHRGLPGHGSGVVDEDVPTVVDDVATAVARF